MTMIGLRIYHAGMSEHFVDVSYRGLEVGRRIRLAEVGPSTAYLEHGAPLPVGSEIALLTDHGLTVAATVLRVYEQVAGVSSPGMRIGVAELDKRASAWWSERVTVGDAAVSPPSEEAPAPVPEEVDVAVTERNESPAGARTEVVEVVDVAGLAARADAHAAAPDEPDTRATQRMSAVEIADIEAVAPEKAEAAPEKAEAAPPEKAEPAPEEKNDSKKKKRRRRKKKR